MATLETAKNFERDLVGVGTQFGLATVIIVTCVHLFEVMRRRPRFQHLFTPRCRLIKNPSPPIPKRLYGWIPRVWSLDEKFYYTHVGLDAVMYLRFLRMVITVLLTTGIIVFAVLIPVNYCTNKEKTEGQDVNQFSISNLPEGSRYFWIHLTCLYAFCFTSLFLLFRNSLDYIKMYGDTMMLKVKSGSIVPRSVLVAQIPRHLRTDEALRQHFEQLGLGTVENATIIRNYQKLCRKIASRKGVLQSLEQAHLDLGRNFIKLLSKNPALLTEALKSEDDAQAVAHNQACHDMQRFLACVKRGRKGRADLNALLEDDPMLFWRALSDLDRSLLTPAQPKIHMKNLSEMDWDPAIDTYLYKLSRVERRVRQLRKLNRVSDNFKPTDYGVVTFTHMNAAQATLKLAVSGQLHCLETLPCPEPRDLIWTNFLMDSRQRWVRMVIVNACVWTLIIVWLIPMASFLGLASLEKLKTLLPFLMDVGTINTWLRSVIERNLPSLLVSLAMVILPFIVLAISRIQFFSSHSALEEKVIERNFFFSIFNVLIFFCIGPPLLDSIQAWLLNPVGILDKLTQSLIGQGEAFFINYVILTSCSHALELAQIGFPLFTTLFADNRWVLSTPRKTQTYRAPWSFPFFYYMHTHMLIFVITLTFVVISPLIIPFSLYYFISAFMVYKHQFAYAYVKQFEANGRFWIQIANFSMFGVTLAVLIFIIVMALKQAVAAAITTVPLFFFCIAYAVYMRRNLFPRMKVVPLARAGNPQWQPLLDKESPVAALTGSPLAGPQFPAPSPLLNTQHRDLGAKPQTTPPTRGSQLRPSVGSGLSDGGSPSSMDSVSVRMDDVSSQESTSLRLPRWFRPWMRRVGLHAVLNRWSEFRRNLFVSQVDYTLHDEETIQMYRGVRPRTASLQAALNRELSARKVSDEIARAPETYSHLRVPREVRALARRNLCRSYSDSAPGSASPHLTVRYSATLSFSPTMAPLGTQTPLLDTHSACPALNRPEPVTRTESVMSVSESERSQYQYLGTNLRHRQDLSTPVESYYHPRLLKPITRRLWLPANPLRRLYHDLEKECIELDYAIVTAPLLATNPHAGRLRSTWAMEDQHGVNSGSKKSLLAHIPYLRTTYHVLNQTAKDLTANLRPLHSGGSGSKTNNVGGAHDGHPARRVLEEQDHSGFMGYLYHQRHRRRSSRKRNLTGDNLASPTGLFQALRASFTTPDRKARSDRAQSLGSGTSISDQYCTISMTTEGSENKARDRAVDGLLPTDGSGELVQLSATLPVSDLDILTAADPDQRSLTTAVTDANHSHATAQSELSTSITTTVRPRLRRHSSEVSPRLPEPTLVSERTHSWCMASTLPTRRRASSETYPLALSGTTRSVDRRLPVASVHDPPCLYELPHDSPIVLGSETYASCCQPHTHNKPSHPCPQSAMLDTSHDTSHPSHSFSSNDTDSDAYSSDQGEGRAEIRDLYNEEL